MKKCVKCALVLGMLGMFSIGCASAPGSSMKNDVKRTMTKCPKCAAFFSTKEGAETFEYMKPH